MTDYERIDNWENLFVTLLFEPNQNQLSIEIALGNVSETQEEIFIDGKSLGLGRRVGFNDNSEKYIISFDSYISYFVLNESFDIGIDGEFSGNRIREYKNSAFINFCKKETNGFFINDESTIKHFVIVTQNHIINVLTTSKLEIERSS